MIKFAHRLLNSRALVRERHHLYEPRLPERSLGAPYVSSVVHYQGVVYMASDAGVVQAVDAATGERLLQGRTGGVFGGAGRGRREIYFMSETGEAIVLAAKREFEILAPNPMKARVLASPAISGGQIFLRSDDRLIPIGKAPEATASGPSFEDR